MLLLKLVALNFDQYRV